MINLVGLVIMGWDKGQARLKRLRISERTLFIIAFLGGAVGVLMGMYTFRHKTKNRTFVVGIPLILLAQIIAAGWLLFCKQVTDTLLLF